MRKNISPPMSSYLACINSTQPSQLMYVVLHPMVDIAISLFSSELNFRDVEICNKVVVNVASIPFIVKTILLIEDNDTRHRVMDTSLFKRIILNPRSVGL